MADFMESIYAEVTCSLMRAPAHFMRALPRWVMCKMKGDLDYALMGRAYCLNLLPGILAGMRSKIQPMELK